MKYKILIFLFVLTSCSSGGNYLEKHSILLEEKTEKHIERCLSYGLGYIRHNNWRVSCIGNGVTILNANK